MFNFLMISILALEKKKSLLILMSSSSAQRVLQEKILQFTLLLSKHYFFTHSVNI